MTRGNPMKNLSRSAALPLSLVISTLGLSGCDAAGVRPAPQDVVMVQRQVEASCGQCQFGMPGSGCTLAIRFDGQGYYVDGSDIDDHGDAHGTDGLCNAIRNATVSGRVTSGRFKAERFALAPASH